MVNRLHMPKRRGDFRWHPGNLEPHPGRLTNLALIWPCPGMSSSAGVAFGGHIRRGGSSVHRHLIILTAFVMALSAAQAGAADPSAVDRNIRKEPTYAGKPRYCLLVFGPDARERVWLVHDGDTLYVDRNGNGDLTEQGEKVAASKNAGTAENEYTFEAGDVTVGGKTHKALSVWLFPLKRFANNSSLADVAVIRDALKADPDLVVARLNVDVASVRFKGAGVGGRVLQLAGFYDLTGVMAFSGKPSDAPVVHFDGPLQVN